MDWFEKIKSMDYKQLAKFLSNFDCDSITDNYCEHSCLERNQKGHCKHNNDCIIDDSFIIEKWLHIIENDN